MLTGVGSLVGSRDILTQICFCVKVTLAPAQLRSVERKEKTEPPNSLVGNLIRIVVSLCSLCQHPMNTDKENKNNSKESESG